ncbi:Myosin-binding protein [Actinidia chinensis var. chinensis]|uniref:Myosin-binding protein n=1 Tax=Actinidia chinensis var. chinensis TaxID=1590841 RepID=A0A2R6PY50_ACTCC|nr:Myosin-binding protein [Actinidia chinensis var. chinensis]
MVCRAIHSWTVSGLVGAFLDLSIVYLLLCASTLAFFASKFLGFFGLTLPCPCNGLLGTQNGNYCLQRLLVDFPVETVSSVQLSVQSKFPFDSIWTNDRDYQLNLKLIRDRNNCVDGFVEIEGEPSNSSISGAGKSQNDVIGRDLVLRNESGRELDVVNSSIHVKEGRFDLKGKGTVNLRPRSFRRRRKSLTGNAKVSPVSSSDPSCADAQAYSTISHKGNKAIECSSPPVNFGADADHFNFDEDAPVIKNFGERMSHGYEFNETLHGNKSFEKNESSFEDIKSNVQKELGYEGHEKNAIRILEQALDEEHAARAALYLELEKERSAAASAADEAMAMILRLQEEKASIEMEARQYQRIIEEKSAYDAEEMNILEEILLMREKEKHCLEKEVEAYRQMNYTGNDQLQDGTQGTMNMQREGGQLASSLDLSEDPVLMLQKLSESIDKKEIIEDTSSNSEISSIDKKNCTLAVEEELRISGWDEESDFSNQGDMDKQFSHTSGSYQELYFSAKTITLAGELQANQLEVMASKTIEACNVNDIHIPYAGENLEQHGKDAYQGSKNPGDRIIDLEPHVHDVHVIDGNINDERFLENSNIHRKDDLPLNASEIQRTDLIANCSSTNGLDAEPDINRTGSDMNSRLPPLGRSSGKSLLSELRRNSMSAVGDERLKIDMEVGWLRERLRIVQEGREKLNFSMEHREREKIQLQLLEDISHQLQEIRQLTEPGKAVRQASLPLPSSKVISRKRRCRSASLGVHKSS